MLIPFFIYKSDGGGEGGGGGGGRHFVNLFMGSYKHLLTVFSREDDDRGGVWSKAHVVKSLHFDLVLQEIVIAANKSNVVVVETLQLFLEPD